MTGPRRRRTGLSEQAATAAIDQACRALRLSTVRDSVEDLVTAAEYEKLSYRGFLAELLLGECDDRDRRRCARRVKAAGFPGTSGSRTSTSTPTLDQPGHHQYP
ncbi:MAG: ATP-binding protein, partial [Sciscionella sp.]